MKTVIKARLARLEAQRSNRIADKNDSKQFQFKMAVMLVVAFHAGELTFEDSFAAALARGLSITALELKNALKPDNYDRLNAWVLVLEKLNDLSVLRGGLPIVEGRSLIFGASQENDDGSRGLEMLDQLYDEIPDGLKGRHHLLPHLANYFMCNGL